ncbi:SLC13 family permease [Leptospira sp. GIMC2001]|uniref:SLC13 family permease n=1 Tax=Leptospira sp. GIMC2001 TaxID=1513297 RepID=UPI00234B4BF4|nr:DASS family sodium-coupled anion symporter [Leptospira sp. GIMC2001]WCL48762.1 DASS family sodium-coupled anion symporter [Leptospira sp. GIMC2001]
MILSQWFSITIPQEITIFILIVACVLWITEAIPLYATSFLILFIELTWLLPSLSATHPNLKAEFFLAPFFSDTVLLFLGGFVISSAVALYGIDRILAQSIVGHFAKTPNRLMIAIVFTTSFLSLWMNNTATTSLMIGLVIPILDSLPEKSGWRKAIFLAIPFSSNVGGMGTPVGTLPNAIAVEYLNGIGMAPSFLNWMLFSIPVIVVVNGFLCLLLPFLFCRNEQVEQIKLTTTSESLSKSEIKIRSFIVFITLLTIVGWLTSDLHGFSNGTIALIPVLVFFSFRILKIHDFRSLAWDVLILMGGGISMGRAIEVSGLAKSLLASLNLGDSTFVALMIVFSAITLILSSVMSNTSTANLMIPLALGLTILQAPAIVILVALTASVAMPLPVSTPPNAIAFGYGFVSARNMLVAGISMTLTGWVAIISLGYFLMKWLGIGNL